MSRELRYADLCTTEDLCEMFAVTRQTVYNWRMTEGMPSVRIPGKKQDAIRFVRKDVLAWAKRTGRAPTAA